MHDSVQQTRRKMDRVHQQHRVTELCPSAAARWYRSPALSAPVSWNWSPVLREEPSCMSVSVCWSQGHDGSSVNHWQSQTQSCSTNSVRMLPHMLQEKPHQLRPSQNVATAQELAVCVNYAKKITRCCPCVWSRFCRLFRHDVLFLHGKHNGFVTLLHVCKVNFFNR